ncbi:MAG: hypothetical protein IJS81_06570 [Selenomonadaceae bacterium]|nr:hypothetical protein [Selenomonadaceae bacterium]MBQ7629861.1 hypothetical protein [Selenomonadaceae bacterium]
MAICEEIPLAMEDDSLDKLLYRVKIVASELNNLPKYESLFINLTQREKMIYS